MTPAVSPAKFTARPAVLPLKRRVTGFNSLPPFCRMDRVIAKSAALRSATVVKRARFSLSQNLGWSGASGGLETAVETTIAPGLAGWASVAAGRAGAEVAESGLPESELRGAAFRVATDTAWAKAVPVTSVRTTRYLVFPHKSCHHNARRESVRVNLSTVILADFH